VDARTWIRLYLTAAVVFVLVDLVWLTLVADRLYDDLLGDLLRAEPLAAAAVAFYALFVAGLVHFVVVPSLEHDRPRRVWADGAFFGLVSYATWDLTSLAVLDGFPAALVPVDLAWGAVLAATVCGTTYHLHRRTSRRRPG
jgi:uncharacterized membrane protein